MLKEFCGNVKDCKRGSPDSQDEPGKRVFRSVITILNLTRNVRPPLKSSCSARWSERNHAYRNRKQEPVVITCLNERLVVEIYRWHVVAASGWANFPASSWVIPPAVGCRGTICPHLLLPLTPTDVAAVAIVFSSCRTRDPGQRRGPPRRCVSGVRPGSSSMFCALWQYFGKPVGRFPYH